MNDDKRAELLMDHYNDTFEHILSYWKTRNRLFGLILALLTLLALDWAKPGSLAQVANAWINKTLACQNGNVPVLDFSAVGALAWFFLLCLVIQYYQRSIHVDRQYNYISDIEEKLCAMMGGEFVTREGKSYFSAKGVYKGSKEKRPLYLRAVGPLYVYVFPVVMTLFVLCGLWRGGWHPNHVSFWLNALFGLAIAYYNVIYLRWVARRT